ncbi:MAG: flagellar biosynthetic protein FliR [Planctomycetia bacterium]
MAMAVQASGAVRPIGPLLPVLAGEVLVGFAMGIAAAAVLAAAGWAGGILGSVSGLSWADDFDPAAAAMPIMNPTSTSPASTGRSGPIGRTAPEACTAIAIGTATTASATASAKRMRKEPSGRIGSVPVPTAAAMRPHTPTATTISGDSASVITGFEGLLERCRAC